MKDLERRSIKLASIVPHKNKEGIITSYYIRIYDGTDSHGKMKIRTTTFKVLPTWSEKTARKKAEAFASTFERDYKTGAVSLSKTTFEEYGNYVLDLKEKTGTKQSTIAGYRALSKRVYEEIGSMKLKDLKSTHINQLAMKLSTEKSKNTPPRAIPVDGIRDILNEKNIKIKELAEISGVSCHACSDIMHGRSTTMQSAEAIADALGMKLKSLFTIEDNGKTLSPKTVKEHIQFVRTVLDQAVLEELVTHNVAAPVKVKQKDRAEPNHFEFDQVDIILEKVEDEPIKWKTLAHLLLVTGCRRGEALGLKWDAIDLEKGEIKIRLNVLYDPGRGVYVDTPKTKNAIRTITIPEEMVAILKQYRVWQLEERLRLGSFYNNQDFVFTQDDGSPMHPCSVTTWMKKFGKKCGFRVNAHAFRHTSASLMIYSGVDNVVISKRLGHGNPATTQSIYAHVMEKVDRNSSEAIADIIYRNKGTG